MKDAVIIPRFLRKASPVFKYFLDMEEVSYDGMLKENIISLATKEKGQKGRVLMISMIRREEAEIWEAYRGFMADLLINVGTKLHGIFRFELLSIHLTENLDKFQRDEFMKGMAELARGLTIGKPQFVQYCSILGVLTKHADEDYGNISFKPQVQILDHKPEELDIPLQRLVKAGQTDRTFAGPNRLIFYDLGRSPLYDPQNREQAEALLRMSRKFDGNLSNSLKEIVVIDQNGLHQLFQRSQFELELF